MDFPFMQRFTCLVLLAFSEITTSTVTDSVSSTHYKMAIGQGECSITVSEVRKNSTVLCGIAVIADIGSSSFLTDPKYDSADISGTTQKIFTKRTSPADVDRRNQRSYTDKSTTLPSSRRRARSSSETSITGGASIQKEVEDRLQEYLQGTKYWFVFLSHPDKDHINYLAKTFKKFPEVRMSLVAGGEWFSNPTADMTAIYSMLQTHKDRIVSFFPYDAAELPREQKVKMVLESSDSNPRRSIGNVFLDEFQGTFKTCLEQVYPNLTIFMEPIKNISSDAAAATTPPQKTLYEKFWAVINVPDPDRALIEKHVLEKIYFLSLDYRLGDANAQSLVWFHAVDDLGWTFLYTGDAEPATLEKVHKAIKSKESEMQSVLRGDSGENLVMLQGMHHGSRENFPDKGNHHDKVTQFIKLINPHAVCFSAGNGASFAHPHYDAVKQYRSSVDSAKFWARYQSALPYMFTAFEKSGSGVGYAIRATNRKPLVLCTNSYGTIKITEQAISVHSIMPEGYIMYDALHAYETTEDSSNIRVDRLTKNPNAYATASFWKVLASGTLILDETSKLYGLAGDDKFKLKRVKKGEKYYLYVLEKLPDEPDAASEQDAAAAAKA